MRRSLSFRATSLPSCSEKYVMRLCHVPNDHSGGSSGRPTSAVYDERISFGSPKNMKKSMSSSAMNRRVAPMYDWPKSHVTGAAVCMKIPYPRLEKKNGIGLYMSGVSGPCGSVTKRFSFCPTLLRAVALSPQPYMRSPGERENTGFMLRLLSAPRFMNKNGGTFTCVESLSLHALVCDSSLPSLSRMIMRQGYDCISMMPLSETYLTPFASRLTRHWLRPSAGGPASITSSL